MDSINTYPADIEVGVVGIGLMGSSIIVSLLVSGHRVKAIAPIPDDMIDANAKIINQLRVCKQAGLLIGSVSSCLERLQIGMDYNTLAKCELVMECVIEDIKIKDEVYKKITDAVACTTVIASNTSAIAITLLQKSVKNPKRFIGVHWAEPAYATRFMEITCGDDTDGDWAEWVFKLAHRWGKEPTLLRKDIRGFITNRLMYAVYREVFALTACGKTTMEDADKAFRYDVGSWITLMGLFSRIDFTGVQDHAEIFKNLFPTLSNSENIPDVMRKIVDDHGRGIQNLNGLYNYTDKQAKEWEQAFAAFSEDIVRLAALYSAPLPEK